MKSNHKKVLLIFILTGVCCIVIGSLILGVNFFVHRFDDALGDRSLISFRWFDHLDDLDDLADDLDDWAEDLDDWADDWKDWADRFEDAFGGRSRFERDAACWARRCERTASRWTAWADGLDKNEWLPLSFFV